MNSENTRCWEDNGLIRLLWLAGRISAPQCRGAVTFPSDSGSKNAWWNMYFFANSPFLSYIPLHFTLFSILCLISGMGWGHRPLCLPPEIAPNEIWRVGRVNIKFVLNENCSELNRIVQILSIYAVYIINFCWNRLDRNRISEQTI